MVWRSKTHVASHSPYRAPFSTSSFRLVSKLHFDLPKSSSSSQLSTTTRLFDPLVFKPFIYYPLKSCTCQLRALLYLDKKYNYIRIIQYRNVLATHNHNFLYQLNIHHDGGNTMRYRCTACGNKCTISVKKGTLLTRCPVDDRDAVWKTEDEAPTNEHRMKIIKRAMRQDAKGCYIKRIDPADPWGGDIIYRSISDAARDTNISKGSISRAVKSGGKSRAGDYYWDMAQMTRGQCDIRSAAQDGVEPYREALRKHDPMRYLEVFGGEE